MDAAADLAQSVNIKGNNLAAGIVALECLDGDGVGQPRGEVGPRQFPFFGCSIDEGDKAHVFVLDVQGREVMSLNNAALNGRFELNVAGLEAGAYTVVIRQVLRHGAHRILVN